MSPKYFDTKQLEAFSAVVSVGSMTGAAKAIGRSQSVVTRLLQDLEADVGFPLLHRSGPRISPTSQGLSFYEQVEVFLSGMRTISERAEAIRTAAQQPLHIVSTPALATSLLPACLARIDPALMPEKINIHSISPESVVQALIARTAEIGISSWPLDNPGIEVHWQAEVMCNAAVSESHPLAQKEVIEPADLRDQRLIVASNPYRLRMPIVQALEEQGVPLGAAIHSNTTYTSLALARRGLGIAIVEPLTAIGLPVQGIRSVPLSFPIPFRWCLVTAVGRPRSALADILIRKIPETAEAELSALLN